MAYYLTDESKKLRPYQRRALKTRQEAAIRAQETFEPSEVLSELYPTEMTVEPPVSPVLPPQPPPQPVTDIDMTEHRDLFGEIVGVEENEIIKISREAVERRREAATKQIQLRINGTVRESGYAVYADFDDYMEVRKRQEQLGLANWDVGRVRHEIRDTLLSKGWTASSGHPETRFYPPELPAQRLRAGKKAAPAAD